MDFMGLNFYPQWSSRELYLNSHGRLANRAADRDGRGFAELIAGYWQRYRMPIVITETSARGSDAVRSAWLQRSLATIKELRGQGVPVVGYTWFPMLTMIDWRYRFGRRPVEEYRLELGLYRLRDGGSPSRWEGTTLVEEWRESIAPGSAGPLRTQEPDGRGGR
jgi:hypothetical protein